ncbi:hypothetical protein NML43_01280 [Rhodopseudomonas palustris]|uniref:hypothetical protein n=1 Tax=Rhodopseudomonas palustris TaxID=1076 RepID=UPI0020CE8C09|nr:hypothetical protein [Rhodopseudomonas palustris]MCP9625710.1 hypothetical protein [Rhodopseudomonas palustris]
MDEHRKEPISEDQAGAGVASSGSAAIDGNDSGAVSAGGAESSAEPVEEPAASNQVERRKDNVAAGKDADRLGKVTIMAPSRHENWYRNWDDEIEVEAPDEPAGAGRPHNKRQLALVAVAVILAAIAGAAGGALTNAGFVHLGGGSDAAAQAQSQARALDTQVAKLQAEIAALKDSVDQAAKTTSAQIGKATDRLEKIEKAQAEPAQKIARLTETVEKLRTAQAEKPAPAPAPAQVASAAQDITGSVSPKPVAAKPNDVGRLPTVEGWVLRDVYDGAAVVVGRSGTFEVYAGDPLPGLGRVDAIRRQDGRWVVVTSRGLIVAR